MPAGTKYRNAVKLWFDEGWNKGNFDVIERIFHYDSKHEDRSSPDPRLSHAQHKRYVTRYRKAFPDLKMTIDDMTVAGNKVICEFTVRGTHRGPLLGIEPTGKRVKLSGVSIFEFYEGKVRECNSYWNSISLFQQLGVDQPFRKLITTKSTAT